MHDVTPVAAVRSRAVHGRITAALVAVEVILSGVLCAWQIGRHSMWLDEAVTAGLAHAPTKDFLKQVTGREINSVLYFTLVRAVSTVAGHGEASLRALSALAVAATVVPVYLLGRDLASRRTGLTASLLWAVSPRAVQLGQEARGFALETFLLALSAVVLLRAFRTGRRAAWAWWSALTLLAGLCHLLSTFVSVSLLTPLLLAGIRAGWRPALLAVTTALAPLAALAAVGRTRGAGHLSFLTGLPLRQVVGLPGSLSYDSVAVAALLCVACVAALVGVGRHWAVASLPERAELLLPVVWLVLPVVGACAYSLVVQPVFTPRYLVTVLPAFILLASLGLRELGSQRGLIAAAVLAAVSLAVVPRVWSAHDVQAWRPAVASVLERAQPGDAAVTVPSYDVSAYVYAASRARRRGVPTPLTLPAEPVPDPTQALAGASRVWTVATVDGFGDTRSAALLRELQGWHVVDERRFGSLTVRLLTRP